MILTPDICGRALREVLTVLAFGDPADTLFAGAVDPAGVDVCLRPVYDVLEETLKIWLECPGHEERAERDLGICAVVFQALHNATRRPEQTRDLSADEDCAARRLLSLEIPAPWEQGK